VQEWIRKLREEPRCEGPLASLLSLVENNLLNVDPDTRIKADQLERRIKDILDRAQSNPSSLAGVTRPPTTVEPPQQHWLAPFPRSSRSRSSHGSAGVITDTNNGSGHGQHRSAGSDIEPQVQIFVTGPSG
jgi:hypothetical protein